MKINKLYKELRTLNPSEHRVVYEGRKGTEITVLRTDKICPYDFAVGLKIPEREEFHPTHIRLFFDLYIKNISNQAGARELFAALEKVFEGLDPEKLSLGISNLKFPMQLDSPEVNLYYSQLLMIEQDFNYGPEGCKKSNFKPPRNFFMSFIRWIASEDSEIDKIIFNAVRNYPPPSKYKRKL